MKTYAHNRAVVRRRKPQQSCAQQTSWAIQDAFVRLLTEKDYDAITIRDIVDLAGTGLGNFYEYFANKDDLAKISVDLRTKKLLQTLKDVQGVATGVSLERTVQTIIDRLLTLHADHPAHWGAHYLMERRFSSLPTYARVYERFVDEWKHIIFQRCWDHDSNVADVARACLTIAYGMVAHAHIVHLCGIRRPLNQEQLRLQLTLALSAYLAASGHMNKSRR